MTKNRLLTIGLIAAILSLIFIPKIFPQLLNTSVNLNTPKPSNKKIESNTGNTLKSPTESEDPEEARLMEALTNKDVTEFYNQIIFPLEMSDTPTRAVYYNGNLDQETIEKLETLEWSRLRVDFISPTCVRHIYNSWLENGNLYLLYFVDRKLKLASLFRKNDDWQLGHQHDIQMLSRADPSLFQEAQMEKQRKFEIYKAAVTRNSNNNQEGRKSRLDNYIENMQRAQNNTPTEKYMEGMLDIERQRLRLEQQKSAVTSGNSYNTNCRRTSNGEVNCQTSSSSQIIDLR